MGAGHGAIGSMPETGRLVQVAEQVGGQSGVVAQMQQGKEHDTTDAAARSPHPGIQ